jgi:hypothetical protein
MKFSVAAVLGAAAAVQAGYSNVSYTTEVVTAYTTYCPYATTLTNNGQTITVTEVRDSLAVFRLWLWLGNQLGQKALMHRLLNLSGETA